MMYGVGCRGLAPKVSVYLTGLNRANVISLGECGFIFGDAYCLVALAVINEQKMVVKVKGKNFRVFRKTLRR